MVLYVYHIKHLHVEEEKETNNETINVFNQLSKWFGVYFLLGQISLLVAIIYRMCSVFNDIFFFNTMSVLLAILAAHSSIRFISLSLSFLCQCSPYYNEIRLLTLCLSRESQQHQPPNGLSNA